MGCEGAAAYVYNQTTVRGRRYAETPGLEAASSCSPNCPSRRSGTFARALHIPQKAGIVSASLGRRALLPVLHRAFHQTVEAWDEPRLLRFGVTANPPPMHEWSPYANIAPKHLHGYLVAEQGQFSSLNCRTTARFSMQPHGYRRLLAAVLALWSDADPFIASIYAC